MADPIVTRLAQKGGSGRRASPVIAIDTLAIPSIRKYSRDISKVDKARSQFEGIRGKELAFSRVPSPAATPNNVPDIIYDVDAESDAPFIRPTSSSTALDLEHCEYLGSSSMTIFLVVNPENSPAATNEFLTKGSDGNGWLRIRLANTDQINVLIKEASNTADTVTLDMNGLSGWQIWGITIDVVNNTMTIARNLTDSATDTIDNNNDEWNQPGQDWVWNGNLMEYRRLEIWNEAFTLAEMQAHITRLQVIHSDVVTF